MKFWQLFTTGCITQTRTVLSFTALSKAADKADYDNAIQNYKEKSLYDTGVTAEYGDKLITLVTCSYHEEHGRFVVVARQR